MTLVRPRRAAARRLLAVALLAPALACGAPEEETGKIGAATPEPGLAAATDEMEPQVARRFEEAAAAVRANPGSAAAWGRYGRVAHAHELWEEAARAYEKAERLDPGEVRWPYFLGDVLSVVGTDRREAAAAFRRALALDPDYAPAHLRLGRVLEEAGESDAAARALERALELDPGLEPARVTLGQIELARGDLERAEELLETVLAESPRHEQALVALAQVLVRQGRREEAEEVAERTRDAASYNLFSDPLMSEVVAEGASSVLLWERAKAYLESGDYRQAVLGLRQVVELEPGDPDVHHQLAYAYDQLGELERARRHLERTVELAPERVDPRVQLGSAAIDSGDPGAAVPHLEAALESAPERSDARWLLGRALAETGRDAEAIEQFERAEAAGRGVPPWADVAWGTALARSGRAEAALERFRSALAADPDNPQALFFAGLTLEGLGRPDEAVSLYCRSLRAASGSPAAARLEALGRGCPGL